jgi:uncharacterized protein YutE (UPF0331/DUF86 family)
MSDKMNKVRIKNLIEALEKTLTFTERLSLSEDEYLRSVARRFDDQLSDMSMELGMMLADDEDGTKSL